MKERAGPCIPTLSEQFVQSQTSSGDQMANFLAYSNSRKEEGRVFIHLVPSHLAFYIVQLQFLPVNPESPEQAMDSF